ncbi:hypothetical protein RN001_000407 [Aquatica leii]|uniref:DUF4806 domain-containing protein n=1 Tax=Aquatica leii TaxID=1421715 RepID=A0AAN7PM83_9COLE|nr:hypothetical protein RN001_000407 [Aquatica leii]
MNTKTCTREKLYNAIRKSETLNTCWPTHKIKIFRCATYRDYLKARSKARIAESTSYINTEPGDVETKRKRIKKIMSSSDDSIEDESRNGVHQRTEKIFENVNDEENLEPKENCHCKDCLEKILFLDRAQKNFTQQYHILRGIASDILEEQTLDDDAATTSFFTQLVCQFHLNLQEDLTIFNQILEEEGNFKNAVTKLSRVGGSTTYSFVPRTLKLILTNELALSYSWLGRKGKNIFKTLKIATLIIGGICHCGYKRRQKIEQSIQLWLRRAFDRKKHAINKSF